MHIICNQKKGCLVLQIDWNLTNSLPRAFSLSHLSILKRCFSSNDPCKILYMRSLGKVSQEEYIHFLVEISVENGRESSQEFSIQNLDISLLRIFREFSIQFSHEKPKSSLMRIFNNSQKSFRMKNSSFLLRDFMSILSRDTHLIFLTKKV